MKKLGRIQSIVKSSLLALAASWTGLASAQIGTIFDFSGAAIAGAGCDADSVQVSTLGDMQGRSLLIIGFDRLNSELYGNVLAGRSACAIRAKMHLPAGVRLTIDKVRVYGDFYSENNVRAAASAIVSVLGTNLPQLQRSLDSRNGYYQDFEVATQSAVGIRCSAKAQDGFLGINAAASIQATTKSREFMNASIAIQQIEITYRLDSCR